MKNHLVLLSIAGQLFIYMYWCFFIMRDRKLLWQRVRLKKSIFVIVLMLIALVQLYKMGHESDVASGGFWLFILLGELLIKLCLIFTLGTGFTYYFLAEKESMKVTYHVNRLFDISVAVLSLGFVLFNLSTYVWIAEMMFFPACFFLFSMKD